MTLLIVDDERNTRVFMRRVLERLSLGFTCIRIAENGLEALELAEKEPPDIIITDVVMPWLSGHELVEKIREINPNCVFIMISGHDDVPFLHKAIQLHVFMYIFKPINIQELTDALTLAIEDCKRKKQITAYEAYSFLDAEVIAGHQNLDELRNAHHHALDGNRSRFDLQTLRLKMTGFVLSLLKKEDILIRNDIYEFFDFTTLFAYEEVDKVVEWYISCFDKLKTLKKKAVSSHTLLKACNFIEENYRHNIGSREIAEHCKISPGYLSALFKKKPNISIPQYVTNVRLKHAIRMLQEDELSVSEIAARCGFSNINYFSRLFKSKYGKTPSEMRREEPSHEMQARGCFADQ